MTWLWLLGAALAQDVDETEDPPPEETPDLEIVVESDLSVAGARAELDDAIRDEGYFRGVDLGTRTFYYPKKFWKPRVTVHDEGFVRVKARVFSPFPCFPLAGVWAHPHVVRDMEARVVVELNPELSAYRRALVTRGLALRKEDLLLQLDALEQLPPEQAQVEAVNLWLSTADTEQGESVRRWIEGWYEDHLPPLSPEQVVEVNGLRQFPRPWQPTALGEFWFDEEPDPDFDFLDPEEEPEFYEPEVHGEGLDADIQMLPPPVKKKKNALEKLNGGG